MKNRAWSFILIYILVKELMQEVASNKHNFRQARCIQPESEVYCENIISKDESPISYWPPGSYSIPMPVTGCSETAKQGWRAGYISVSWSTPHTVYSVLQYAAASSGNFTGDILLTEEYDITDYNLPNFPTFVYGPFRHNMFKLNFCHKERRNETLDTGSWPPGNYSIYSGIDGCPEGFLSYNTTIRLDRSDHWSSDGYLPEITVENDNGTTLLRITLCSRNGNSLDLISKTPNTTFPESPFMLLKEEPMTCPSFENFSLTENTLNDWVISQNATDPTFAQSYCFYIPQIWKTDNAESLLETLKNNAYMVSRLHTLDENIHRVKDGQEKAEVLYVLKSVYKSHFNIPWKLVDLGRTLSVTAVKLHLPSGWQYTSVADHILTCHISKEKWCFLHFCSYMCMFQTYFENVPSSLILLFQRWRRGRVHNKKQQQQKPEGQGSMNGRYIALTSNESRSQVLQTSTDIDVYTDRLHYADKNDCKSDLGMTDGGILDFQITASSFHQEFPVSSGRPYSKGWCASSIDNHPYIQVDLLLATSVEGVSVWNWQQVVTTVWDTIIHFGVEILKVSFGDTTDNLIEYNKVFHFDMTRPFNESQTFWFIKPITTRHIRLEIVRPITKGLNCLRFELHGCRVSGIPSMQCSANGSMFNLVNVPVSPKGPNRQSKALSSYKCEEYCLQDNNCSSVSFKENTCFIYGYSQDENFQLVMVNSSVIWSTKLCVDDKFSTVPTLIKVREEELSSANVMLLTGEGFITSTGYPFFYPTGQTFKWIVQFETSNYVKIIFTNISLNTYEERDVACKDSLLLSKEIIDNRQLARVIDNRFNGPLSVIETGESLIIITMETCLPTARMSFHGKGFRAIIAKQSLPACFTLDPAMSWEVGSDEICSQSSMILTSMSLLGLPFSGTAEQWKIIRPGRRIHLKIEQFQVECKKDDSGSEFFIMDLGVENSYCNLNKPPKDIYSSSDTVLISFFKGEDLPLATFKEGFRLTYSTERVSMENLISYQAPRSNITNVALGKPAIMSSLYIYQYPAFLAAGKGVDGTVHLDAAFGACFHTRRENEPWWMVDLQGIYIIDRIVLYNKQENNAGILARNIEISVGLQVTGMIATSYFCGSIYYRETFDQNNIKGRFVKLQVKYYFQKFHLCEVEVYGVLDSEIDERSKREFSFPAPIQGNWGSWSSWSNLCYCNGTQPRTRVCDNPAPLFGGRYCVGSSISSKSCTPDENCEITNVALRKRSTLSSTEYTWSTADLATDGSTVEDKFSCFKTKYEYQPWWKIDLKEVFELKKIVVHYSTSISGILTKNVAISIGIMCEMNVVYYNCGEGRRLTISLIGYTARFVKLQLVGIKAYLNLCEIEIYGQSARLSSNFTANTDCSQSSVDGQYSTWSQWGTCSEKCGIGKMTRTRKCDNPAPSYGGRPCFGKGTDIKQCIGKGNCPICSEKFGKCYSLFPEVTNWNQAGYKCWRRNMKLVSIRSEEELRFIKYLLRENRYRDKQPLASFDKLYTIPSYWTHIGLYRYSVGGIVKFDMWEDKTSVTFTAWNSGEPSMGNCVRMNYKSFDDIKTWESEDCQSVLAEYFICEQPLHNKSYINEEMPERHGKDWIKVPEQITSAQYKEKANVTMSGKECISWVQQATNPFAIILWQNSVDMWKVEESKIESENYCRDPGGEEYVWCHYQASDNITQREECSVHYPTVEGTQHFEWRYLGKWNKTYTGKTCQRWDSMYPHFHNSHGHNFPGETITSVANYCRDQWDSGYLWCYTMDTDTRWELCIVDDNPDDRCGRVRNMYSGSLSKSFSGKACLRWKDNRHYLPGDIDELQFPDISFIASGSYCRDPLGNGYLWCFVDENGSWEPCSLKETDPVHVAIDGVNKGEVFLCASGEEVLLQYKCDGKFDCNDLSDETGCLDVYKVQILTSTGSDYSMNITDLHGNFVISSYFHCNTSEWISVTARCDGVKDCIDASDEINCSWTLGGISQCSYDQFTCGDGDCIHLSQVCNFVDDCIDGSDEYCDIDECEKSAFQCTNGQCVSVDKRCNGFAECEDGSDESSCDTCQENVAFHCDIVRCIPIRLVCDQYKDCEDGKDEISCRQEFFISCEQWWEAGYRKSGPYVIGGLSVDCDFDWVLSKKKMYTIIRNFDILWRDGDGVGYLYSRDTFREEDVRLNEIIKRPNYSCVQQVTQSCIPSHQAAAEFDDPKYENSFSHCKCISMTTMIEKYSGTINNCYSKDSVGVNADKLVYSYNASLGMYRKIILKSNQNIVRQGYQIIPGSTVCEYDYYVSQNVITCEGDVKVIPNSINCLYDVDASGYIIGCRSGSHLQNCEDYICHAGSVKCPNSYCIPLRFVCDGELQCPGGEDEHGCGCEENDNEIIVLYNAESEFLQKLDVYGFAKQFKTKTNTVRLLQFVSTQPLQDFNLDDEVLQITDTEIQPMSTLNRIQECKYKVMARNFLKEIGISANKSNGILYIEDNTDNLYATIFRHAIPGGLNLILYRVMESAQADLKTNSVPYVTDVLVRRWTLLNTIGAVYFSDICKARTKVKCLHNYQCKWSKMCLPMDKVCDGNPQCPHGDDEQQCDFKCPFNCTCIGHTAKCNDGSFNISRTRDIPRSTRLLDLSLNKDLKDVMKASYLDLMVLVSLNLSACKIEELSRFAFRKIRNVKSLDLSFNSITLIQNRTFSYLSHLRILRLEGNFDLTVIQPGAFETLSNIRDLNFSGARLEKISANTFSGLSLQSIDLSNNSLEEIENYAFSNLSVKSINFENNIISLFRKEIFTGVTALESLRTPAFKFCCTRPNYLAEKGCYPSKDEFSSCDDLMRLSALQTMLWLIGLSSLVGNALTIIYRIMYDRERLKIGFGIFVTNLAVADFLMGVYLLIIATADAVFRKRYIFMDEYWRNSVWCNLAGVLSTISSEASVFFLCLITMDRLLVIKFPFGEMRFDTRKSTICAGTVWILSIFFATLPVVYDSYFKNKFYTKSGVCIALPLTRDRPPGWVYSVALFVGLNFATFVLVAFGQWSIFVEIRRASSGLGKTTAGRKNDLKVARNLLLVVLTDFMCWFPIGVMGMMALNGHVISGDVYAWSAVFILPINSALNPILYTASAIIGRKKFNPSTDEQCRNDLTKEIGMHILNFQRVSRHFSFRRKHSTFRRISSLLHMEADLGPKDVLKVVRNIAKCLDVLHSSSLVIVDLNVNTVCLGITNEKLSGDIQLQAEPRIANSPDDTREDILNLGKIVRVLLSKCQERRQ